MVRSLISSLLLALILFSQFYNSAVWLRYELNVEEITELFCVNKDKPALMCNGKCYVKGELIDIDIFPQAPQAPITEVSYLPTIKLFVVQESVFVASILIEILDSSREVSTASWSSEIPEPPFIPPQLLT